ncbi:hypothetical protein G9Q84_28840 [Pseudomonas sp. P7]|uniref:hypothetical protein n=1 Tax=Pseudomonas sivasensis TaxID=1880678 RepID=UPI0015EBE240|nr:hypothetical protein [Pseudomonas sivasensis]MBA2926885.1 hypothetical protein [Pseudomonas sivasensis]GFM68962.1 hypothetical protein PSCICJ_50800 [Pseudomonas cichorii]
MSASTDSPYILTHAVTITFEGEALDALNRYRQVCHAANMTVAGSEDEREAARLRAASDLAGWVAAMATVAHGSAR